LCTLGAQSEFDAREEFRREGEKELAGRESKPHEIIYFKIYKSRMRVIEQALETASLMLGSDKSRGDCLEVRDGTPRRALEVCSVLQMRCYTSIVAVNPLIYS
jgi:hypothetical protein